MPAAAAATWSKSRAIAKEVPRGTEDHPLLVANLETPEAEPLRRPFAAMGLIVPSYSVVAGLRRDLLCDCHGHVEQRRPLTCLARKACTPPPWSPPPVAPPLSSPASAEPQVAASDDQHDRGRRKASDAGVKRSRFDLAGNPPHDAPLGPTGVTFAPWRGQRKRRSRYLTMPRKAPPSAPPRRSSALDRARAIERRPLRGLGARGDDEASVRA